MPYWVRTGSIATPAAPNSSGQSKFAAGGLERTRTKSPSPCCTARSRRLLFASLAMTTKPSESASGGELLAYQQSPVGHDRHKSIIAEYKIDPEVKLRDPPSISRRTAGRLPRRNKGCSRSRSDHRAFSATWTSARGNQTGVGGSHRPIVTLSNLMSGLARHHPLSFNRRPSGEGSASAESTQRSGIPPPVTSASLLRWGSGGVEEPGRQRPARLRTWSARTDSRTTGLWHAAVQGTCLA